jgi:probable addiction module antidote protein
MSKNSTRPWDAAEHLQSEADMVAYLEAAFEDGDPSLIAAALGDIARARGMTQVARAAGLGRESLYKALSAEGHPEFATIMKVLGALGLRLHASAAAPAAH